MAFLYVVHPTDSVSRCPYLDPSAVKEMRYTLQTVLARIPLVTIAASLRIMPLLPALMENAADKVRNDQDNYSLATCQREKVIWLF